MAKIFILCVTLAALVVIADSKSLSHTEEICHDCAEVVGTEEKAYKRSKRDHEGLKFAKDLTLGILGTTWNGIVEVNKLKQPRPRPIIVGPGNGNTNRVMINNPYGYNGYYDDYNGGSNFNYRNPQNYNY
ncbi:uncharacterized protein LOC123867500 [Maniola jurtina]|uniref:uncharacterized protein LOC123867500 n=1 Tax=Maniola jurtina TaxID=191418 RepID=UPI001E68E503|nr:uncharacterized protein LOC123867500 [Maniola jurtina]